MKTLVQSVIILFALPLFSQNISVDATQYTAEQLVRDVLINSGCIQDINVTHTVSGPFNGGDKSFGYFENNGGPFPFADGIVMSTGKLSNVPGPNNNLSDDDAPGWGGDADLENFLDLNPGATTNATIIEFDFTPNANNIRFRYIFASEEYRENNTSTCQYSDAFAFLIKPIGGQYENIALVPGTNTPVKVTTVHPAIPGGCDAENQAYFGGFNGTNAPINFNGQTAILVAKAQVSPGQTYHIKLVIADEANYRYDSAVFLEGSSFNIGANLGDDISGLCAGETYTLAPQGNGNNNPPNAYAWYRVNPDGTEVLLAQGQTQDTFVVSQGGTYKVVLDYGGGCVATDEIKVSYVDFSTLDPITISACLPENSSAAVYDLSSYNLVFTQGNPNFTVAGFYLTQADAENENNPIGDPAHFETTTPNQVIYARIESARGCWTTLKITLTIAQNDYGTIGLAVCDPAHSNFIPFNLNNAIGPIQDEIGQQIQGVDFYETAQDAVSQTDALDTDYEIGRGDLPQSIYARIGSNLGCEGIIEIRLELLPSPKINPNYTPPAFCPDSQGSLIIHSGIIGDENAYTYEWANGATTPTISVSAPGSYQVQITDVHLINGETVYCTVSNTIEVVQSERARVSYRLTGDPGNYKVVITAVGSGNYVYSVDNPNQFFPQNTFPVSTGRHTFYVKDLNGCGLVERRFYAIGFMKFFTPNGDGKHDFWRLLGVNPSESNVKEVEIFDRYGKLLIVLSPYSAWDGTFNGNYVSQNDYWFKIVFKDGSSYIDHLTLVR